MIDVVIFLIDLILTLAVFFSGYALRWYTTKEKHKKECIHNYVHGWKEGKKYAKWEFENLSISNTLEMVKTDMCDSYCKYPEMSIPEGKDENWLLEDDASPCLKCPLNRL